MQLQQFGKSQDESRGQWREDSEEPVLEDPGFMREQGWLADRYTSPIQGLRHEMRLVQHAGGGNWRLSSSPDNCRFLIGMLNAN